MLMGDETGQLSVIVSLWIHAHRSRLPKILFGSSCEFRIETGECLTLSDRDCHHAVIPGE